MKRDVVHLDEAEGRSLVRKFGIQVTESRLFHNLVDAASFANTQTRPLAVKIVADGIPHKRRHGCLRLNVNPAEPGAVRAAIDDVVAAAAAVPGAKVRGVLLEPMAPAGLEITVGGVNRLPFGPAVMFGIGGTYVEVLRQVGFRLAPLTPKEAINLIEETGVSSALQQFYESSADDLTQDLASILTAVAGNDGLMLQVPISEIDINPVIVSDKGLTAVDVKVSIFEDRDQWAGTMAAAMGRQHRRLPRSLEPAFTPASIAVVGASTDEEKLGFRVLKHLVDYGFKGSLFGIHPRARSISGCRAYPSILDVPESIERVAIVTEASTVPRILEQCVEKGVKIAQIYSAGFSEWSSQGSKLEDSIRALTETGELRVIGPNCIGTYCPKGGLTMISAAVSSKQPGGVAFVSQSGTYATDAVRRGHNLGLAFSKVMSVGNCVDVDMVDFLRYLAEDPETHVIAMYLEAGDHAGEFFRRAQNVTKPIVLMKGGRTRSGTRAVSSHTGRLAGEFSLWEASAAQAGVLTVQTIEKLLDLLFGYQTLGLLKGNGLAVFGSGGGVAVLAADMAEACGLKMASLNEATHQRLEKLELPPGTSIGNPIDVHVYALRGRSSQLVGDVVSTLASDPEAHSCIVYLEVGSFFDMANGKAAGEYVKSVGEAVLHAGTSRMPTSLVFRSGGDSNQEDLLRMLRNEARRFGIPVFSSVQQAVWVHGKLAEMYSLSQAKAKRATD